MAVIIVVTEKADVAGLRGRRVVTADEYLDGDDVICNRDSVIINLCREIDYGSKGYYVSLLADARGQHVIPTIKTMAGLSEPYARFRALQDAGISTIDAGEMVARRRVVQCVPEHADSMFPVPLVERGSGEYDAATETQYQETLIFLGRCLDERFQHAARVIYAEWPAPLLRLQLAQENGQWKITQVAPASPATLSAAERRLFLEALGDDTQLFDAIRRRSETVRASIAVLVDLANQFSPSSPETIDRLERVASRMNVHIARIGLNDLRRLPEYDALFVRAHTSVTHNAFQFSLRAEALGMPVVDATQSTIRCTNKVYIEELLSRADIATPRTKIITSTTSWEDIAQLGLPFVLKQPDGDFSAAVHKISSRAEFESYATDMFARSPLLIAQQWLPTDFDWRIGVIGGKLLFAARYFMARGHWQIRTVEKGNECYGRVEAVPRSAAPAEVVAVALKAAALIGEGFYGVDIKETPAGPVVIEINDNPNLDLGYEDTADGDLIYEDIVRFFVERIERPRG